jgi:hypothetical protein
MNNALENEIKQQKYHTVGTVRNSNRKIKGRGKMVILTGLEKTLQ